MIKITGTISPGLEQALKETRSIATGFRRGLIGHALRWVRDRIVRRLRTEKAGPDGEVWPPLSPNYRPPPGSMLYRSRALAQSFRVDVGDSRGTLGTASPYAAVHQFGYGPIPARPYFGLGARDRQDFDAMLDQWVRRRASFA